MVEDAGDLMFRGLADAFSGPADVPWEELVRRSYAATFDLVEQNSDAVTVLLLAERRGTVPSIRGSPALAGGGSPSPSCLTTGG